MNKSVVIINGMGGVGKDTLCELAARHFSVKIISAITPIKEIAQKYGWNGEKDAKSRKFLSDLKRVFIEYNDLPTQYLYEEYKLFFNSDAQILFVHIREPQEIDKLKALIQDTPCFTVLVERQQDNLVKWGNASDDDVMKYSYDYYFKNDKSLAEAEVEFAELCKVIMNKKDF